jgi:4a-hydroxytetrahydrobiopterin dehydratase
MSTYSLAAPLLREAALCKAAERGYGKPMDLQPPPGWTRSDDGTALERTYRFKDFANAFAFLTRVAAHAEAVDHHPEFTSVWNRVAFRLTTHDAGGVTARDIDLAKAIDALVEKPA